MSIEDRSYRHYTCDAPGCTAEADTEHNPDDHEPFHAWKVNWGHHTLVMRAVFCERHTEHARAALKALGFEERLR